MVARLNSHESNLINCMNKHAKAAINTHTPGFLGCTGRTSNYNAHRGYSVGCGVLSVWLWHGVENSRDA